MIRLTDARRRRPAGLPALAAGPPARVPPRGAGLALRRCCDGGTRRMMIDRARPAAQMMLPDDPELLRRVVVCGVNEVSADQQPNSAAARLRVRRPHHHQRTSKSEDDRRLAQDCHAKGRKQRSSASSVDSAFRALPVLPRDGVSASKAPSRRFVRWHHRLDESQPRVGSPLKSLSRQQ